MILPINNTFSPAKLPFTLLSVLLPAVRPGLCRIPIQPSRIPRHRGRNLVSTCSASSDLLATPGSLGICKAVPCSSVSFASRGPCSGVSPRVQLVGGVVREIDVTQSCVPADEIHSVAAVGCGWVVTWDGMSRSVTLSPMQVQLHERVSV